MPPVDVFAESESLKRRRALLQALQQQGAAPQIQGNSGQAIAQLLAALGTSYFANKGLSEVDQRESANRQEYQSQLGGELESFMSRMEGQDPQHTLPEGIPGPSLPGVEPDPRGAVFSAMASRFPELQNIGQATLPSLLKPPKDVGFDEWKIGPDGTPFRTNRKTGALETGPGRYVKPEKPLVQIDNYPKAEEKIAEGLGKSLSPGGDLLVQAQSAQEHIDAAREANYSLLEGASTGTAEPFFQTMRGFVARFTGADPKTVNTATLGSQLAQITLKAAGGSLGNQVSNADRDFIAEANGSVNLPPEALKRILAIQTAVSIKRQFPYMKGVESLRGKGGVFGELEKFGPNFSHGWPEDPTFEKMVENVLQNKPSMTGVTLPRMPNWSPSTSTSEPGRGGLPNRPPIQYNVRGG